MYTETTLKSFIFSQLKPFKLHMAVFGVIGLLWSIDLSFAPYLIKMMLDRMTTSPPNQIIHAIGWIVAIYLVLGFVMACFYRLWQVTRRSMIPRLKAGASNYLTQLLIM